mmetsp:Transcript_115408/g.337475  ORF Transcript_115408/g.337475 Transcript_115408/m.337475 type:complete len:203 (-) Transcript_115408:2178-2786(-)
MPGSSAAASAPRRSAKFSLAAIWTATSSEPASIASAPEEAMQVAWSSAWQNPMKTLISSSAFPVANRSRISGAMVRLHMASSPARCTSSFSMKSRSLQARQASALIARNLSSSLTVNRLVSAMAPSNWSSSWRCSNISTRGRTASSCSLYCSSEGFVTIRIWASAWRAALRPVSSSKSTRPSSARTPPLLATKRRWSFSAQR